MPENVTGMRKETRSSGCIAAIFAQTAVRLEEMVAVGSYWQERRRGGVMRGQRWLAELAGGQHGYVAPAGGIKMAPSAAMHSEGISKRIVVV